MGNDKYKKKFQKYEKKYKVVKDLSKLIQSKYPRNKYFKALIHKVDIPELYNNFVCKNNYNLTIIKFDDWNFKNERFMKINKTNTTENRYHKLKSIYHKTESEYIGNVALKEYCDVSFALKSVIEDYTRGISRHMSSNGMLDYNISNGFTKMYEILDTFKLIPKKDLSVFKSYHMAEAPGQFILCTRRFIDKRRNNMKHKWYANSLNPYNDENIERFGKGIFSDRYGLMKKDKDRWLFGEDDTGDITKSVNVDHIKKEFVKNNFSPHLITGDAGLANTSDYILLQKLDYAQFANGIILSNLGGHLVIKTFTPFVYGVPESKDSIDFFVSLLFMVNLSFEKMFLFKPITSSSRSGEFYVICKNFTGAPSPIIDFLKSRLDNFIVNVPLFLRNDIPDEFIIQIYEFVRKMSDTNTLALERENIIIQCSCADDKKINKILGCDKLLDPKYMEIIKKKRFNDWIEMYKFK